MPSKAIFEYVIIPKVADMSLGPRSALENVPDDSLSEPQQLGGTLDQNSSHTVELEDHKGHTCTKTPSKAIFEYVIIPKVADVRLGPKSEWEKASHASLSKLQRLGGTPDQSPYHTVHPQDHDVPRPPKVSFGQNFECGDTPKLPQMRLEHSFALANALSEPLNDFLQFGGTQNQNSQASVFECHIASAELIAHKKHAFGCEDTPKMPNELREHRIASPSAFTGPLNDFPQLGGTQNQNSQYASVCEGHGAPRPPEVSFGQNFECEDTPK